MPGKNPKKSSAEDDDSYQHSVEYHELMKKRMEAKQKSADSADEDIQPLSLDELSDSDWGRGPQRKSSPRPPRLSESQPTDAFDKDPVAKRHTQDHRGVAKAVQPAPAVAPVQPVRAESPVPARQVPKKVSPASDGEPVPGSIFRLEDGSIAIFKDAVSGKDYALLYFLEPDGRLMPRGIFFEQYDRIEIGRLPVEEFETAIALGKWDYDLIVYHLTSYQYAKYLRSLLGRTPHYDSFAHDPGPRQPKPVSDSPQDAHGPTYDAPPRRDEDNRVLSAPVAAPEPEPEPPAEPEDPLQRGRIIRIDIGGRAWEAIYLLTDAMGPVLAHDTNNEWQLMHLDLTRFRDSLEYGPMVSDNEMAVLEKHLADSGLIQ